jgi:hypothetical protein
MMDDGTSVSSGTKTIPVVIVTAGQVGTTTWGVIKIDAPSVVGSSLSVTASEIA